MGAPLIPGGFNTFMSTARLCRKCILSGIVILFIAGCATAPKTQPHHYHSKPNSKPATRQQPKPVDAEAQQQYYDLGLQHYSKENYQEAQKSFQAVVELGPNTTLGMKSQENLKKIHQILKTLEEIESK